MTRISASTAASRALFAASLVIAGSCAHFPHTVTDLLTPAAAKIALPHQDSVVDLVALRAQVAALRKEDGYTRMRVAATSACSNCGTAVEIAAFAGAKNVGPDRPPSAPQAVAIMENIGPYPTQMYAMKRSTEAYYLILAEADSAGKTVFVVAEVPRTGTSGLVRRTGKGRYKGCGHSPATKNVADFRSCMYAGKVPSGILRMASQSGFEGMIGRALARASAAMAIEEDPAWVSCTDGCCVLQHATM